MSPLSEAQFHPMVAFWLKMVVLLGTIDGFVFLATPDLIRSGAYAWAFSIFPEPVFGAMFAVSAIGACSALYLPGRRATWRGSLARATLVVHGFCSSLIGLSIFVLTLDGTVSAIVGATKWWVPFAMAARILWMHSLGPGGDR